jgi:asparagine synthase (glutamine-hydrolysing)
MSEMVKETVKTFSIGYGVEGLDETGYAKVVADHLGTDHEEIFADSEDVIKEFDKIVWHLDEPIGDAAFIAAYFLSRQTRKKVTVVFGGGGADEVFAGYRAYKYAMMAETLRANIPYPLRTFIGPLSHLPFIPYRAGKYMDYVASRDGEYFFEGQGILFNEKERAAICSKAFKDSVKKNNPLDIAKRNFWEKANAPKESYLNRLLYTDIKGWLAEDCLAQVDRMSMAHSLEARAPYLDHVLVEYANKIPPQYKVNGWTEKYILRKAAGKYLPKEIMNRRKRGFTVPTDKWLFKDLWSYTQEIIESKDAITDRILDRQSTQNMITRSGDFRDSTKLFGLLVLESWNKTFLGGGR